MILRNLKATTLVFRGLLANVCWLFACFTLTTLLIHALVTAIAHTLIVTAIVGLGLDQVVEIFSKHPDYQPLLEYVRKHPIGSSSANLDEQINVSTLGLLVRKIISLNLIFSLTLFTFLLTYVLNAFSLQKPEVLEPSKVEEAGTSLEKARKDLELLVPKAKEIKFSTSTFIIGKRIFLSLRDLHSLMNGKSELVYFKLAHEQFHASIGDGFLSGYLRHLTMTTGWLISLILGILTVVNIDTPGWDGPISGLVCVVFGRIFSQSLLMAFQANKELHADLHGIASSPCLDINEISKIKLRESKYHPSIEQRVRYLQGGKSNYAGRAYVLLVAGIVIWAIFKQFWIDQKFGEPYPDEHLFEVLCIYLLTVSTSIYFWISVRPGFTTADLFVLITLVASLALLSLSQYIPGVVWHFGYRPYWFYSYTYANFTFCFAISLMAICGWMNNCRA